MPRVFIPFVPFDLQYLQPFLFYILSDALTIYEFIIKGKYLFFFVKKMKAESLLPISILFTTSIDLGRQEVSGSMDPRV